MSLLSYNISIANVSIAIVTTLSTYIYCTEVGNYYIFYNMYELGAYTSNDFLMISSIISLSLVLEKSQYPLMIYIFDLFLEYLYDCAGSIRGHGLLPREITVYYHDYYYWIYFWIAINSTQFPMIITSQLPFVFVIM